MSFLRPYGGGGGQGWTTRTTSLEAALPRNAIASSPVHGAAAWAWGSWVTLEASTPADFYPHHLNIMYTVELITAGLKDLRLEVEIAIGAAGSEVLYGRISDIVGSTVSAAGSGASIIVGRSFLFGTTQIPSGSRVAARVRKSQVNTAVGVLWDIYLAGYDTSVPAADLSYLLDDHLGGAGSPQTLQTPSGSMLAVTRGAPFGTYGAYVDVLNPAPQDLLVVGVGSGRMGGFSDKSTYFQIAVGAPGAEVVYGLLPVPGRLFLGAATAFLRRPVLVLSGERFRVRGSGLTADAVDTQWLYTLV